MIDITIPFSSHLPVYPGDPPPEVVIEQAGGATISHLRLSSHAGTHVDAPRHLFAGGLTVDALSLDLLCGPCYVAEVGSTLGQPLTPADFASLKLPTDCTRLLLRTPNSEADLWQQAGFASNYTALSPAAAWLLALPRPRGAGLKLLGIDYLSVDPFWAKGLPAHRALLAAGVVIVEGLDLRTVRAGAYQLTCLPLKLLGGDGAPARVLLT